MPKVFAIVPAAGHGTRIGDPVPKQYLPIAVQPMMYHSIHALAAVSRIERIFVVLSPEDPHWDRHDWSQLWWVRAELRWQGEAGGPAAALGARLADRYPQYRDQPFERLLLLRIVGVPGWAAAAANPASQATPTR